MKEQHAEGVVDPALLARLVDPAEPIKAHFHWPQNGREKRALAVEDARHVPAERLYQRDDDRAVDRDMNPAIKRHGGGLVKTSPALGGHRPGKRESRQSRYP